MRISDWSSDVCSSDLLAAAKGREAAEDRLIVAKGAIARQRQEIVEQPFDIMFEVRPLGVPRDLRLLPRRQPGIGNAQQLVGLGLKPRPVGDDIQRAVRSDERRQGEGGVRTWLSLW